MDEPQHISDAGDAGHRLHRPLPPKNRFAAIAGLGFFVAGFAVVLADVWLYCTSRLTISEYLLAAARVCRWVAFGVGFALSLLPSTLTGHLFAPTWGERPIVPALAGAVLGVVVGTVVGWWLFPQSGR
jgi:hypothetical protein